MVPMGYSDSWMVWGSAGAQQGEAETGALTFGMSCPRYSQYLEVPPAALSSLSIKSFND